MAEPDTLALIVAALKTVEPDRADQFEDLSMETSIEDLELDSIALMEMVGFLEDQLETTFDDEAMAHIERLEDLARLVEQARAAQKGL